jgi:hypothetical protein
MNISARALERIRDRPALYIGTESLIRLQAFIQGYSLALSDEHVLVGDGGSGFTEFSLWLSLQFRYPTEWGYVESLTAANRGNDQLAFRDFWKWREKYLCEPKRSVLDYLAEHERRRQVQSD